MQCRCHIDLVVAGATPDALAVVLRPIASVSLASEDPDIAMAVTEHLRRTAVLVRRVTVIALFMQPSDRKVIGFQDASPSGGLRFCWNEFGFDPVARRPRP